MLRTKTIAFKDRVLARSDDDYNEPFDWMELEEEYPEGPYAIRQVVGRTFLGDRMRWDHKEKQWVEDTDVLLFSGLVVFEYEDNDGSA